MNPEAFEQLVSEWLDEPQRDDLRARIDAAAAATPELAATRERLSRLNLVVRAALPAPGRIEHAVFAAHVSNAIDAALDQELAADELSPALEQLPGVEKRVDWSRFGARICAAVGANAEQPRIIRFPWRTALAAGTLAAAAAIAAFVFWPRVPLNSSEPIGVAIARVVAATGAATRSDTGDAALARVSIAPPENQPRESFVDEPMAAAAEVVLVIDPPLRSGPSPLSVN